VTQVARSEAAALAALYAAARPNETLEETVARLMAPTYADALEAVELAAFRDLSEPPP
jgi:hypothetical protein